MRSLRGVWVGIVVLGVLGIFFCEAGIQAQQSSTASGVNASNQALASSPEKTTDDQQTTTPPVNERQKKLAADTDKLLALATDLKKQVDKTNKDILSVEVVKKAEEIEKLARSMKIETK